MASDPGPRDFRELIVLVLVLAVILVVAAVAVMGVVTAGMCAFDSASSCSPDTVQMTTLRATLDMILPPLIGFVAAVVGFHFGEKSGRTPGR